MWLQKTQQQNRTQSIVKAKKESEIDMIKRSNAIGQEKHEKKAISLAVSKLKLKSH